MSRLIPGRATLNAQLLVALLKGGLSWRQAIRQAAPVTPSERTGRPVILGFVPNTELPSEILITNAPLRGSMIPVASLAHRLGRWVACPQIMKADRLQEYEAVAVAPHDWIVALAALAAGLRVTGDWRDLDFWPWTIAAAWPDWEAQDFRWNERAKDLAVRTGSIALSPNSLLVKCGRLGLVRVTK